MKNRIYSLPLFITLIAWTGLAPEGAAQTTWLGGTEASGLWTAGAWSNGVPGSNSTAVFERSATSEIALGGGDQSVQNLVFGRDADAYHFTNGRFSFGGSGGQGVRIDYGSVGTQLFDVDLRISNSTTATTLRNDSTTASLIVNGDIYGSTGTSASRALSLTGIGGGTINGNLVDSGGDARPLNFGSVNGGGRWILAGNNTFGGSLPTVSTGATLVLDYRKNGSSPMMSGSMHLNQGRLEVVGHASNASTLTFTQLHFSGGGSRISTTSGSNGLVVDLGAITRSSGGVSLVLEGDAEFRTSTANLGSGSAIINASIIYNNDFAANDGTGKIVAFGNYTALPAGATGGNSSTVYSGTGNITLNLGANAAFVSRGIKIDTTAEGQSMTLVGTGASQQLTVGNGNSLLFVGAHDYTINATYLGGSSGNNSHWIAMGEGVLTLNGQLQVANFRKAGLGTILLNQGAEGSTGAVSVEDGKLIFQASDITGAEGSTSNTVVVQNGATLQLQNNSVVRAHSSFTVSGLGLEGGGALRNESGANTVEGDIALGNTARITAHFGTLTLNGAISGADQSALEFNGAGRTIVNGVIGSGILFGVQKLGEGILELTSDNSYTGGTYISGGSLLVNNTVAGTSGVGTGAVVVENGGTLGGTGYTRLEGANSITVKSGGRLAPGASIGTLVLDGGGSSEAILKMDLGAVFAFELGELNASDTIEFWNYAGVSDFILNNTQINFSGAQEGEFTLFRFFSDNGDNGAASGLAGGLVLGTGLEGFNSTLHYNFDSITLTLTAVPEPGSILMAIGGGVALVLARRRHNRRRS